MPSTASSGRTSAAPKSTCRLKQHAREALVVQHQSQPLCSPIESVRAGQELEEPCILPFSWRGGGSDGNINVRQHDALISAATFAEHVTSSGEVSLLLCALTFMACNRQSLTNCAQVYKLKTAVCNSGRYLLQRLANHAQAYRDAATLHNG